MLAAELVHVEEVLAHVGSEDDIDQPGPDHFKHVTVYVGQDVDPLV